MPRAIWSGSLSFGLVSVPVKAYSAVHDHNVHFHQLQKKTGARIQYEKVSAKTGKKVPSDEIERGFELGKGKYVVVDAEELDALRPKTTRTVDITDFVDLNAVDPIFYDHTYWLAPDGEAADRAYRLLVSAMETAERVAIGTVVMRNKQYLAAIRPLDGALAMSTMRFADEVVSRKKIDGIPAARSKPAPNELKLAGQIIDSLASDWDPKRYHDTYTEELRDLIERKAKGEELVADEPEDASSGKVIDLMEALQASLDAGGRRRGSTRGSTKAKATKGPKRAGSSASKRPAAKRSTAKRRSA
jgi:DNA end-binding protein Ku